MKKLTKLIFLLVAFCALASLKAQSTRTLDTRTLEEKLGRKPIVLAYVTSGSSIMPDPNYVTHINYAFGSVSKTFDGINIQNEPRLKQITALKKDYPDLKVVLSIGGWGSGRFSEMASDKGTRESFAADCKRVIDEFDLDGVDLDWEYPSSSAAGISSSPDDVDNFTQLMKDIRSVIGQDKLLTLASAYSARYYDFPAILPYVDFVNIMTYDMGRPPFHNSPLHRSAHTARLSIEESVQKHIDAGFPIEKLTLGMPFYGHAIKEISDFIDYKDVGRLDEKYIRKWDDEAKCPYFVDEDGKFICSYDDARSLEYKCKYAILRGMLGVMYWEYTCDDADGTLRKAVYNTIMNK